VTNSPDNPYCVGNATVSDLFSISRQEKGGRATHFGSYDEPVNIDMDSEVALKPVLEHQQGHRTLSLPPAVPVEPRSRAELPRALSVAE
jgi:hypothetical protein